MEQIFIANQDIIIKLVLAMVLGMVIGIERYMAHKTAGMRTYALLSMGAALFVILASSIVNSLSFPTNNILVIMSAVITGIGFLGAGAMIRGETKLVGLTTATGLWVTAGVGMAVGFGFYSIAVIVTILILFIFLILHVLEKNIIDKISDKLPQRKEEIEQHDS